LNESRRPVPGPRPGRPRLRAARTSFGPCPTAGDLADAGTSEKMMLSTRHSFEVLERRQTDYLPVYAARAAIVVIVFPPVFGHMSALRVQAGRRRNGRWGKRARAGDLACAVPDAELGRERIELLRRSIEDRIVRVGMFADFFPNSWSARAGDRQSVRPAHGRQHPLSGTCSPSGLRRSWRGRRVVAARRALLLTRSGVGSRSRRPKRMLPAQRRPRAVRSSRRAIAWSSPRTARADLPQRRCEQARTHSG